MTQHSHRARKAAIGWGECALLGAFVFGTGLAFYSDRVRHVRTTDGARLIGSAQNGGSALAFGAGAILIAVFAHKWLVFATRWLAEYQQTREVKRQARRAVLITPAPVMDRIQELETRQAQADTERQAACAQIGELVATFADILGPDKAPNLQETLPLPLRLVARDGQIVSKDERDTA